MKLKIVAVAVAVAMLSGCALQQVRPSDVESHIDPISVQSATQERSDVMECTEYANRAVKEARKHAIIAGIAGALIGAAAGAAIGQGTPWQSQFAGTDAAIGMAAGLGATVPHAQNTQQRIIYNCLTHRGYQLLY